MDEEIPHPEVQQELLEAILSFPHHLQHRLLAGLPLMFFGLLRCSTEQAQQEQASDTSASAGGSVA